jgi:pimeloyl-ACP methyl ester carboxylesterase
VRAWTPTLFAREPPTRAVQELIAIMASLRTVGAGTMVRAMAACDLRGLLPRVTVPTLVLHGDEDVRSPRAVAQALAAAIPGATLVVLEGVGHMSNLEAPERFNAELLNFLRAVQ